MSSPWRSTPAYRRRAVPDEFITPCQPTLVHKVPAGPQWQHELKFDGFRLLARKDGDSVRLWSRTAKSWTDAFPRIRRAVAALPVETVVLDGEAMVEDEIGRSDFHALRTDRGQRDAVFVTWDVLILDEWDLRALPLHERRQRLDELLERAGEGIVRTHVFDDGEALFRHACAAGLEGIVSKRRDSPYRSGRAPQWVKVKCEGYQRR